MVSSCTEYSILTVKVRLERIVEATHKLALAMKSMEELDEFTEDNAQEIEQDEEIKALMEKLNTDPYTW